MNYTNIGWKKQYNLLVFVPVCQYFPLLAVFISDVKILLVFISCTAYQII